MWASLHIFCELFKRNFKLTMEKQPKQIPNNSKVHEIRKEQYFMLLSGTSNFNYRRLHPWKRYKTFSGFSGFDSHKLDCQMCSLSICSNMRMIYVTLSVFCAFKAHVRPLCKQLPPPIRVLLFPLLYFCHELFFVQQRAARFP